MEAHNRKESDATVKACRLIRVLALVTVILIPASIFGNLMGTVDSHARSTTVVVGMTSAYEIDDAFGSDTSANYTAITGGMSISGGKAHGSGAWVNNILYHETAISSVNHYVQASVGRPTGTTYDIGSVIARSNGTAYYRMYIDSDTLRMERTGTYIGGCSYVGGYDNGATSYVLKLEVNGTGASISLKGYVDGTLRIDCTDTDAARLTTGSYIGFGINRSINNADATVDDLSGDNL